MLFVLFMLSSTTYDGIHETALWKGLFWKNLLVILQPLWGTNIQRAQDLLMGWYLFYRQASLVLFPFLYLAVYLLFLALIKVVINHRSISAIASEFCYSLLPIALAYHFTHYFPFLVSVGRDSIAIVSDPLALGSSLPPLRALAAESTLPIGLIWHVQVGVVLLGHLAGIYLAHLTALRLLSEHGPLFTVTSQLPLLSLMIIYTMIGLWVLALPLGPSS